MHDVCNNGPNHLTIQIRESRHPSASVMNDFENLLVANPPAQAKV